MKLKREMLYSIDAYTKNDFLEYLKEYEGEDWCKWSADDDYYEWESEQLSFDLDDLFCNLKYAEINKQKCMVIGTLGLWFGNREIIPEYCENVCDALRKCIDNSDVIFIERIGNTIEVKTGHHDGTNRFVIIPLSDKGAERYAKHNKVSLHNRENIYKIGEYIY
jgi:hypothetical protein